MPYKSAPSHLDSWVGAALSLGGPQALISAWGSALAASGTLKVPPTPFVCPSVLGMATPRAKRPRRESSGDLGLSATKPRARRQRGGDGGKRVPGPPPEPVTPGRRRLTRLQFCGERGSLASPSLCPGERGEPLHRGVVPAWGGGQPWAAELGAPQSPPSQPCYKGAYFSGLPADECQDPAVPSL